MPKKTATQKSGSRGKKNCPACSASIGARCTTCPQCSYVFEIKSKTTTPKATTSNSDLKTVLLQKKAELENLLDNRDKLVAQLKSIDELLDTM